MKNKFFYISMVLCLFSILSIISMAESDQYKELDSILTRSAEELKNNTDVDFEDKNIVTIYSHSGLLGKLNEYSPKNIVPGIVDIVSMLDSTGEKYYIAYNDKEALKIVPGEAPEYYNVSKTSSDYVKKAANVASVDIQGRSYRLDRVVYLKDSSDRATEEMYIYFTDGGVFIDMGAAYGIYRWEDYVEIYYGYLKYDKDIVSLGSMAYFTYFKDIFPFVDNEKEPSDIRSKDVDIKSYSDIIKVKNDNINELRNNFKETENYTLNGKNIIVTYHGLFDVAGDTLYKMIENAEKTAKKRYIIYDDASAFKVNSSFEVSREVFDYYYMLKLLEYYENTDSTIKIGEKTYTVEDKVYFWDISYGLVCFYLTDNGIVVSIKNDVMAKESLFEMEELVHLKKCFEMKKAIDTDYWHSFVYYAWSHSSVDHEKLEKEYMNLMSEPDSTPDITREPQKTFPTESEPTLITTPTPEDTIAPPITENEPQNNAVWIVVITIASAIILGGVALVIIKNNRKK